MLCIYSFFTWIRYSPPLWFLFLLKTANTLLFALYQIAINPSIQERLRADIREVVGGDRTIRPEHISKLPLLKNSITEAQR